VTTKIYVLTEPDGIIRYIGKTIYSLSVRLCGHLSGARRGKKSYLFNWIRSVLLTGRLPAISIIGEVEGDGNKEEIAWIEYGRQEGWRLVNTTNGGDGHRKGYKASDESKRKMSETRKGKSPHPNAILASVRFWTGHHHSAESRRKMSEKLMGRKGWNTGKHLLEETKRKISEAHKGKHVSIETRQKMSASRTGKHFSLETRQKMSEANKRTKKGNKYWVGRHHSEESKFKISKAGKGRPGYWLGKKHPLSEKAKENMRLAWQRRKAVRTIT